MSKLDNWFSRSSKKSIINVEDIKNANVEIHAGDTYVTHHAVWWLLGLLVLALLAWFYFIPHSTLIINGAGSSKPYLQAQLDKAQQHVKNYPDDASFRQELKEAQANLDGFNRDILELAEAIKKAPPNTERVQQAKLLFEKHEYKAASAILDAEGLTRDQDTLLANQQRHQAEDAAALTDNATEFLLKARLTAIDYSLPDRIAQTSQFFEQALKSARTTDNLFAYAKFLQENNQFKPAERWYKEALDIRRQLAKDNPAVYLPDVAMTLNNLGNLVSDDTQRRAEAETLYKEALDIRRQLAKDNPAVYLPKVANTLIVLGVAYLKWQEPQQALIYLQEAETILAPFAQQVPEVFAEQHAKTLRLIARAK